MKFLPWTSFYTMTWQKSVVSSTDKKVETSHENFVNWTLTTYFVSNSRLTPLDGFTAALMVRHKNSNAALTTPRTVAE